MNGEPVGTWSLPARGPQQFIYDESWLYSNQFRPLSLSLPAGIEATTLSGNAVESWFDNLLPDSDAIRRRAQTRFQAASTSAFDLLAAVGRDCAGAVQLLPPGQEPSGIHRIEARPLSDHDIGRRLRTVTAAPAPGSLGPDPDELRLSVAGAQEKTGFLWHNNTWCLPLGSTPTSHLFKLPMGVIGEGQIDFSSSVENEWLCNRLVKAYGLPVAATEMARFNGEHCLIVQPLTAACTPVAAIGCACPQKTFARQRPHQPPTDMRTGADPACKPLLRCWRNPQNAATSPHFSRRRCCSGCCVPLMAMPKTSASS
jgi:serine/threonine-protein kinase HipA